MRHPIPDPDDVVEALAGRVDRMDSRLEVLDRDVTALGHALGGINGALREMSEHQAGLEAEPAVEEPPRSWPDVTDPQLAWSWLEGLTLWVEDRWEVITGRAIEPCWPWHARVVSELLTLQAAREAAYALSPLHVVDFEHRHLPDGAAIVDRVLTGCMRAGSHVDAAGSPYYSDLEALPRLAFWWATDRTGAAPGLAPAPRR